MSRGLFLGCFPPRLKVLGLGVLNGIGIGIVSGKKEEGVLGIISSFRKIKCDGGNSLLFMLRYIALSF